MVIRRRTAAAILALSLSLPIVPIASAGTALADAPGPAASAAVTQQLELPRPTGPYATGRQTLHLVDTSRRDPWVPSAGARELMVSMYYPARPRTGGNVAPYMTTEEARLLLESQGYGGVFPPELLSGTRATARTDARPVPGRHPLVVLSPGFSVHRATLTLLSEELAARGYVVALIDHAYESVGTAFPGGRTLTCVACDTINALPKGEKSKAALAGVANGRAADVSFVLDRLTGRQPAWKNAGIIDRKRIGMAGHSIGGNSAARAMASDSRIRAGVNMDGTFFAPVPADGLDGRPFMMLGTDAGHRPDSKDTSWGEGWERLDGWKRWLTVAGSGHFTFIDFPVLGAQLGLSHPDAPLSGQRSGEITRDYVGAFFDQHLRGMRQPLLDGPTPANPEVNFQFRR
ncbi:alpha/beta hydrolase [Streptomyces sp. ISL-98]|uniref:alpha/beta hydrolase family protein n=1 Tax=Streptomyces sp. ISL-98 TaxID=2819192 RepID=UPI001BEC6342|nr:alpha/beta hydrolase [Streptomyces sp. ISL-98]MBT2505367.1 alpha/beta hydrolase [Streptomyces sp. ISL-98]